MARFNRDDIVRVARSYMNVPFRMYGRDRTGVDCIGLLYCIGTELGIEVEDYTDYKNTPEPAKLQKFLEYYTRTTVSKPPRNGQVLKLRQLVFPMHVGILVVDKNRFSVINANIKRKCVVEDSFDTWKSLVLEHREIKGVVG